MSVDYLIRLEQGRDTNPSGEVVEALVDALQLGSDDRIHLKRLTAISNNHGLCDTRPDPPTTVRPMVNELLDRLTATPALVLNDLADLLAWTPAYETIGGPVGVLDRTPPKLLRFTFGDDRARWVYPDWSRVADEQVANLRAAFPVDDPIGDLLVAELTELGGAEFVDRWNRRAVTRKGTGTKRIVHPDVGELRLAYETMTLKAERFDAGEWVDLARDAGQHYLVLTTKHHDGFALFDTETTDYKSTNTPFGRDVVAEIVAACQAGGVGFGPQWDIERFHGLVRKHQPDALMNDRLGGLAADVPSDLRSDFLTPEQSVPNSIPRWSTFGGPMDPTMLFALLQQDNWEELLEQVAPVIRAHFEAPPDPTVPDADDFLPWEACMTFGGQWAWNPELDRCKTGADVITDLVDIASRGGNLLMNVGPRGDGSIQPEFQDALREVGRWLDANGEGVHGTTYGPVQGHEHVRTTKSTRSDEGGAGDEGTVYVHVLPSAPRRIRIDDLAAHASKGPARVVGADADVDVEMDGDALVLDLGRCRGTR